MMRLLEVVGLAKRFGPVDALAGASFTVEEGHVVALVGPAGSGKTTCLACIAGALAPDGGRIVFDGRDITRESPRELERAGIVRSAPRLGPVPRVRLLLLDGGPAADAARAIVELLPSLRAQAVTVIVSARRLGPLWGLVDRVVVLDRGRTATARPTGAPHAL